MDVDNFYVLNLACKNREVSWKKIESMVQGRWPWPRL